MRDYSKEYDILREKELPRENIAFLFTSDLHIDPYLWKDEEGRLTIYEPAESYNKRADMIRNGWRAAVEFANRSDKVDFIALGGDYHNGYTLQGKDFVIDEILLSTLSPLHTSKKPVLLAFGNHDENAFQTLNPQVKKIEDEWIISDRDWKNRVLSTMPGFDRFVFDPLYPDSKYYYCDFPEKKTRVIVLDTLDTRRPFDEKGNVCGAQRSRGFTYTVEQLRWLVECALKCEADWQYVFISHMGIDSATNSNLMGNGDALRALLSAVQWQTPYAFYGTDCEKRECKLFADYRKHPIGRVRMFAFGHQHAELNLYSEDLELWQVCSPSMRPAGGFCGHDQSLPWNFMTWRGTDHESCIAYLSVGETGCYQFSIGPGSEVQMPYASK